MLILEKWVPRKLQHKVEIRVNETQRKQNEGNYIDKPRNVQTRKENSIQKISKSKSCFFFLFNKR
jgi:hypothetical protein